MKALTLAALLLLGLTTTASAMDSRHWDQFSPNQRLLYVVGAWDMLMNVHHANDTGLAQCMARHSYGTALAVVTDVMRETPSKDISSGVIAAVIKLCKVTP